MESKRYNIRMPGELWTRITRYCAQNGLYVNGWIVEALFQAVGEAEELSTVEDTPRPLASGSQKPDSRFIPGRETGE